MAIRTGHREPDTNPADEQAIRELFEKLIEDWGRGDGEAYGSRFTEDADYVAFDGTRTQGREEISASHQQLFDRWLKGSRLTGRIESVRFLGPGVALVHATGGTVKHGKTEPSPERNSIQTLVAVRRDEGWRFAAFHNCRVRPIGSFGGFIVWSLTDLMWKAFGPGRREA
ncbi:MAG: SgcJ/EcaC family oxidoreductase, partial [Rubrobacter sp.]